MNTIRFNFNGGEVNAETAAPIISRLSEKLPSLFHQDRLAYHLEDVSTHVGDVGYQSLCLGYETDDLTWLFDLELVKDKIIALNEELGEDIDLGDGCWDNEIQVFIKSFGDKTYLWVKFCYY